MLKENPEILLAQACISAWSLGQPDCLVFAWPPNTGIFPVNSHAILLPSYRPPWRSQSPHDGAAVTVRPVHFHGPSCSKCCCLALAVCYSFSQRTVALTWRQGGPTREFVLQLKIWRHTRTTIRHNSPAEHLDNGKFINPNMVWLLWGPGKPRSCIPMGMSISFNPDCKFQVCFLWAVEPCI